MKNYLELEKIIQNSESVVFFGGAGVSTESGIPDFRGNGALTNMHNDGVGFQDFLSARFFASNTHEFFKYYKSNLLYPDAEPNIVHYVLGEMERNNKLSAIITQNIDGLHQKAGSKNVIELHGNLNRNYCMKCGMQYDINYLLESEDIPVCKKCGGIIKPDIVLYGESVAGEMMQAAEEAIYDADTLIVGGTSLSIVPAAALVADFQGDNLIIINDHETELDGLAALVIYDDIATVFSFLQNNQIC